MLQLLLLLSKIICVVLVVCREGDDELPLLGEGEAGAVLSDGVLSVGNGAHRSKFTSCSVGGAPLLSSSPPLLFMR